jgi:hypothetical protein
MNYFTYSPENKNKTSKETKRKKEARLKDVERIWNNSNEKVKKHKGKGPHPPLLHTQVRIHLYTVLGGVVEHCIVSKIVYTLYIGV